MKNPCSLLLLLCLFLYGRHLVNLNLDAKPSISISAITLLQIGYWNLFPVIFHISKTPDSSLHNRPSVN